MIAFCLKKYVSYREGLVHNQYFRINIDRHRKGKPDKHTAGVSFYRLIDIISDIRKVQNAFQLSINFLLGKTDHCPVQVNVLNAVVFHIEAGTQFQQCRNPAVYFHVSRSGIQDTGNNFQNRGFAGTVRPDNSHRLSLTDIHIDIPQGIVFLIPLFAGQSQSLFQPVHRPVIQFINFIQISDLNRNVLIHIISSYCGI